MSEDWKNDRAEADMKRHEAEMMAKLNVKQNHITKTWIITATTEGDNAESLMAEFENKLVGKDFQDSVTVTVTAASSKD